MPRVERRRPDRDDRRRQPAATLDDLVHADLIFVVGQNPGTNHRACSPPWSGPRTTGPGRSGQPAAGGRAVPGSRTRSGPPRSSAGAPPSPTSSCRSRVNGDLALPGPQPAVARAVGDRSHRDDRALPRRALRRPRRARRPPRRLDRDAVDRATGPTRDQIDEAPRACPRPPTGSSWLGHGSHPAPHRCRRSADRELLPAAGQRRPAWRRCVPGAGSQQRRATGPWASG